ncbi:MAG: DUF3786 domain-containing protein [Desulfobacterales bacterium]
MAKPKHVMEIFQLLDKSNCRDCGFKTCLAFAGAVYKGGRSVADCPKLDRETIEKYDAGSEEASPVEQSYEAFLAQVRSEIAELDLSAAAERTGGSFADGRLTIKVLGKNVTVDGGGKLHLEIHANPWLAVPFCNYVLYGKGLSPSGNWMSYRELKGGLDRYPLFQKRCEEGMKNVADRYPDLFDDMVHLFSGRQVDEQFESDISVVLHPLPKIPIMICYWLPEEGIDSSLNIFFDETAADNLGIDAVFTLGAGLTQMFEKLAQRHGTMASGASSGSRS